MNDDHVYLTRREATVFGVLFHARPRCASKDRIYSAYVGHYPLEIDWPTPKVIDVQIFRLRGKLAPLGVTIETVRGEGFRLVEPAAGKDVLFAPE
jgi:DNA-binding response OmpR family regulator